MRNPIPRLVIVVSALAMIGYGTGFQAAEQDDDVTYEIRPLQSLGGTSSRGNGINDWGLVAVTRLAMPLCGSTITSSIWAPCAGQTAISRGRG